MSENLLQIGQIAKESGLAVSALRFYQEKGLLEPCYISETKYRYYKFTDIALAKFIKKSQRLGFSLEEIKLLLDDRKQGKSPCPRVRQLANQKIEDLNQKIKDLKKLETELKEYILEAKAGLDSSHDDENICGLIDKAIVN